MDDLAELERVFKKRFDSARARRRANQETLRAEIERSERRTERFRVDAKLIKFTDTYLQTQAIDQYQQDYVVVDPVCGMELNRADAAGSAEFEGKTYYFCVEACRQKFLDDPSSFIASRHG